MTIFSASNGMFLSGGVSPRTGKPYGYPLEVYRGLAKNRKEWEFLLKNQKVKYDRVAWVVETIDASDLGGQLGQLSNQFDPKNN